MERISGGTARGAWTRWAECGERSAWPAAMEPKSTASSIDAFRLRAETICIGEGGWSEAGSGWSDQGKCLCSKVVQLQSDRLVMRSSQLARPVHRVEGH